MSQLGTNWTPALLRGHTFSYLDHFRGLISLGVAPIGHRVNFTTPFLLPVEIDIRVVLAPGITKTQIEPIFRDIIERYLADLRQNVVDEWERTYYNNISVSNAYVDAGLPQWFPDDIAKQTHTWYTFIRPQILGVEFLATGLIDALDFEWLLINGDKDPNGLPIDQTEEEQWLPIFERLDIDTVSYIVTTPPTPPTTKIQATYITGPDAPVSKLEIAPPPTP